MPQQSPRRRHSADELKAFSHGELLKLVLELEERNANLEAVLKSSSNGEACGVEEVCRELASAANEKRHLEEAADEVHTKPVVIEKLERGISRVPANVEAANQLRDELAKAVENIMLQRQSSTDGKLGRPWQHLMHTSFSLPDLTDTELGFEEYIHSKLVVAHYQKALQDDWVLNWWVPDLGPANQLHVLRTESDGNCLLHATLLAIWGLHDTHMVGTSGLSSLRAAMNRLFSSNPQFLESFRKRWELQIASDDAAALQSASSREGEGLPMQVEVSEAQLNRDWNNMADIANTQNEFLDTIHIFALANALWRPILVLASPVQKDPLGLPLTHLFYQGIYLPLERSPLECCRQPLLLCFRDSHFMPLVPKKVPGDCSIKIKVPLSDGCEGVELPLRFALEDELSRRREVLNQYLDVEWDIKLPLKDLTCNLVVCHQESSHPLVDQMTWQFIERGKHLFNKEQQAEERPVKRPKVEADKESVGQPQEEEEDAMVSTSFSVKLPIGARPGDKSYFKMPADCTNKERIDFRVPQNCYEGDVVTLDATFAIKGHCIRKFREVTNVARERAVWFLKQSRGDPDEAVELYYENQISV